jgi:uncharacterized protein YndB with AHSA1/START domain
VDGVPSGREIVCVELGHIRTVTLRARDKMVPGMATFRSAITIDRPLEDVFAVLSDPERTAKWSSLTTGETMISTGPIGVGSTYRVVSKGLVRPAVRENEVTEFELNRRWAVRSRTGSPATRASATFHPVEGGTRIDFSVEAELTGPLRVVAPVVMTVGKRQWDRDLRKLKALMEAGAL